MTLDFHLIVAGEVTFADVLELGLGELSAQSFQVVGEDDAVEVVEFMLHDAGQVAFHPFVVFLELLVLVGDADTRGALQT